MTNKIHDKPNSSIRRFKSYKLLILYLNSFCVCILLLAAYGVVCSALDKVTGRKVAIKKVPKAFDDLVDAKRILREIKLLRHFKHENIVGLYDLIGYVEEQEFEDIYIICGFMETESVNEFVKWLSIAPLQLREFY